MKLLIITHDTKISNHAFAWFTTHLKKSYPDLQFDIMPTSSAHRIPEYDRFLLLGARAFGDLTGLTIHERYCGAPLVIKNVLGTTTYHPTDVLGLQETEGDEFLGTRPENYRFWIINDIKKLLTLPYKEEKVNPIIYPDLNLVIDMIRSAQKLYIDIETDVNQELNCIGLGNERGEVFVVPIYNYNNKLVYTNTVDLFVALARYKNQIVCHNALFDLFVLIWRYHIPFSTEDIYDTMVAHHRVFPEVEKSLGHAMRAWTWLPYHKDEGMFEPKTPDEEYRLYEYNAKDVFGMIKVHENLPDTPSIRQGVASVYPYLITMLYGMEVDDEKLLKTIHRLEKREEVLTKICRILSGDEKFNPRSSQQCAAYFHGKLKYPVVRRTETGRAALGQKELYQLALKHDNPLIPVIIAVREVSKARSMLTITPYER